jgi:hypothetical protein
VTPCNFAQPSGKNVTIVITKEGFNREKKSLTVPANGETASMNISLVKQQAVASGRSGGKSSGKTTRPATKAPAATGSATLKVHTPKSPGTKIFINGKDTGKTVPQFKLTIPAGKVTITLVNGSKTKKHVKNVQNGEEVKLIDTDF